jgi:hypothetical protein
MTKLPGWMRATMLATAAMNAAGAVVFLPVAAPLREMSGLPAGGHPFYLSALAALIFVFGAAYLWVAVTGRSDRLFIAVSAVGKLAFSGVVVGFVAAGELPLPALQSGAGDVVFAVIFGAYLLRRPREAQAAVAERAAA